MGRRPLQFPSQGISPAHQNYPWPYKQLWELSTFWIW